MYTAATPMKNDFQSMLPILGAFQVRSWEEFLQGESAGNAAGETEPRDVKGEENAEEEEHPPANGHPRFTVLSIHDIFVHGFSSPPLCGDDFGIGQVPGLGIHDIPCRLIGLDLDDVVRQELDISGGHRVTGEFKPGGLDGRQPEV
jgi:hypothetical protein